jgi:hypothetical protein
MLRVKEEFKILVARAEWIWCSIYLQRAGFWLHVLLYRTSLIV